AMIHEAFVTLCLCGDRCATGYHKDTKAQRKFVSDISMQSNPHNSAKSPLFDLTCHANHLLSA
ncbi:MAG: hypothetical protein QG666_489, partial [Euryarchaeota archaeon]|nr:hypothetical protein [Euryarchaeota archaeon]